jgi:SAM-dependent methyltransferase
MPAAVVQRQPKPPARRDAPGIAWFATAAGRAVLASEADVVRQAGLERPGQPWLCLSAGEAPAVGAPGIGLGIEGDRFEGPLRCGLPLPIASEAVGTVLVQHLGDALPDPADLFEECQRVLVPGGRLWLLALNPLAPYRWRWLREGPAAREPVAWRRRLRNAGLHPEAVSHGLGPRWRIEAVPDQQHGAGLRAAFLLRAEKRSTPLTPLRARQALRLPGTVPARGAIRESAAMNQRDD